VIVELWRRTICRQSRPFDAAIFAFRQVNN
jgi:hypothetical protein